MGTNHLLNALVAALVGAVVTVFLTHYLANRSENPSIRIEHDSFFLTSSDIKSIASAFTDQTSLEETSDSSDPLVALQDSIESIYFKEFVVDKFSVTNNSDSYRQIEVELLDPLSLIVGGKSIENFNKTFEIRLSPDQTTNFLVTSRDIGASFYKDDTDRRVILSYSGKKLKWPIHTIPSDEAFPDFVAFFVGNSLLLLMTTVAAVLFLIFFIVSTVSNALPARIKAKNTPPQTFRQYWLLAKILKKTDPAAWKDVRKAILAKERDGAVRDP